MDIRSRDHEEERGLKLTELFLRALEHSRPSGPVRDREAGLLSDVQEDGLHYLVTHPGTIMREVAGALGISNPAATRLVDRLVARGFVTRVELTDDRRRVHLTPTIRGRQALETSTRLRSDGLRGVLQGMEEGARRALQTGLEAFLRSALPTPEAIRQVCRRCGSRHVSWCPLAEIYTELTGNPPPSG